MFRRLLATALIVASAALSSVALSGLAMASPAVAPIPPPPSVPARAYLLEDYQTGRVLASDHADDRLEPASLTKLMTAYIVFTALHDGRLKLTDQSRSASTRGARKARARLSRSARRFRWIS